LSKYLYQVKKGEDILITERGKIIVRITRGNPKNISEKSVKMKSSPGGKRACTWIFF
jgi:antitoxin (DNA-binding transcriptional repressor) of toxin-antitoxin stability system